MAWLVENLDGSINFTKILYLFFFILDIIQEARGKKKNILFIVRGNARGPMAAFLGRVNFEKIRDTAKLFMVFFCFSIFSYFQTVSEWFYLSVKNSHMKLTCLQC